MNVGMEHLDKGNEYYKKGAFSKAEQEYKIAWEEDKILDALANLGLLFDFQFNNLSHLFLCYCSLFHLLGSHCCIDGIECTCYR